MRSGRQGYASKGWKLACRPSGFHPNDDVVIARHNLKPGTPIRQENLIANGLIPAGHKVATRKIAEGQPVRRYNQIIGVAKQDIQPGAHVHTHNLIMAEFTRDYAFCADAKPTEYVSEPATFAGIVRPDGTVATRNYVGIIVSVNCSATVARIIAEHFRRDLHPGALADYPNIDGVVALTTTMSAIDRKNIRARTPRKSSTSSRRIAKTSPGPTPELTTLLGTS